MILNIRSLAIGIALGAGASLAIIFAFLQAMQTTDSENVNVLVFGALKDTSHEALWLDQSFNQTTLKSDKAVKVHLSGGTALRGCKAEVYESVCLVRAYDKIPKGTNVCIITFLQRDGSLHAGTVFLNSLCGPFKPPELAEDISDEANWLGDMWVPGIVEDLSREALYIDQTPNIEGVKKIPPLIIQLNQGAAFYWNNSGIEFEEVRIGSYVCAHTRLYSDGSLWAGKVC